MDPLGIVPAAAVALLLGVVGYVARGLVERTRQKRAQAAARDEASKILAHAQEEADGLLKSKLLEGKEEVFCLRESWEKEELRLREDSERSEGRLTERSEALDRRFETFQDNYGVGC